MPCSAQNVETAPRGASSGHCEIARRTRGSIGSLAATARASGQKCHHQDHPKCHRCPDTEPSPMSCDMTLAAPQRLRTSTGTVNAADITRRSGQRSPLSAYQNRRYGTMLRHPETILARRGRARTVPSIPAVGARSSCRSRPAKAIRSIVIAPTRVDTPISRVPLLAGRSLGRSQVRPSSTGSHRAGRSVLRTGAT